MFIVQIKIDVHEDERSFWRNEPKEFQTFEDALSFARRSMAGKTIQIVMVKWNSSEEK